MKAGTSGSQSITYYFSLISLMIAKNVARLAPSVGPYWIEVAKRERKVDRLLKMEGKKRKTEGSEKWRITMLRH